MPSRAMRVRYRRRRSAKVKAYYAWDWDAEPGDLMVSGAGELFRLENSRGRDKAAAGDLTPRQIAPPQSGMIAEILDGEVWWTRPGCPTPSTGRRKRREVSDLTTIERLERELAAARKALENLDTAIRLCESDGGCRAMRVLDSIAPRADSPHPRAAEMLNAAMSTGNEGTIRLAAQLANVPPCPNCGFVEQHCRCEKPAPRAEQPKEWCQGCTNLDGHTRVVAGCCFFCGKPAQEASHD
jgi:hypothetical protein